MGITTNSKVSPLGSTRNSRIGSQLEMVTLLNTFPQHCGVESPPNTESSSASKRRKYQG